MEDYSTCEISDALIKLSSPHGGCLPDISCLSPSPGTAPIRIEGPAYTVKMVLFDDVTAPRPERHFVDTVEEGCVIVIDAPLHVKSAVWGGLMTLGAQARGAKGVVVSGRCRDLAEHQEAGFPVFARGQSTLGQKPFTRPAGVNVPITIASSSNFISSFHIPSTGSNEESWPTVRIEPGDWIVADLDGVVVVPSHQMEKVKELCRKGRAVDELCKADIKAGRGVAETFKKYRGQ